MDSFWWDKILLFSLKAQQSFFPLAEKVWKVPLLGWRKFLLFPKKKEKRGRESESFMRSITASSWMDAQSGGDGSRKRDINCIGFTQIPPNAINEREREESVVSAAFSIFASSTECYLGIKWASYVIHIQTHLLKSFKQQQEGRLGGWLQKRERRKLGYKVSVWSWSGLALCYKYWHWDKAASQPNMYVQYVLQTKSGQK